MCELPKGTFAKGRLSVYKTVYMGASFSSIPEIQKLVRSTTC